MNMRNTVVFCCVTMCFNMVALADKEEKSEEVYEDQEIKSSNNETSSESGPPDSHEAMNNRDLNPKIREKRSYEFLMGLINNNSRYEVTKVDPTLVTENPKVPAANVAASELLLQLMVRIAAHPDHWDKVHKLLRNIDRDLTTSKNIVEALKAKPYTLESTEDNIEQKSKHIFVNKKVIDDVYDMELLKNSQQYREAHETKNSTQKIDKKGREENKWPNFDTDEDSSSVKFVNSTEDLSKHVGLQKYAWQELQNKTTKTTYPKNFAYHRVTGKPIYLNKSPKAYIAVSVISPKHSRSNEEDATLENELRQLKPWARPENLKTAPAKERWLIEKRSEENKTKSS